MYPKVIRYGIEFRSIRELRGCLGLSEDSKAELSEPEIAKRLGTDQVEEIREFLVTQRASYRIARIKRKAKAKWQRSHADF